MGRDPDDRHAGFQPALGIFGGVSATATAVVATPGFAENGGAEYFRP
jgi:hypothetical protein